MKYILSRILVCLIAVIIVLPVSMSSAWAGSAVGKQVTNPKKVPKNLKIDPKRLKKIVPPSQPPQGGAGLYVLDNVDFNPVGGAKIPGLKWNNKIPMGTYYHYDQNSYLIISGTVHGEGLISGPGQDGWTFTVRLDDGDILSARPSQCVFSRSNKPQTTPAQTGWKYQVMIVFKDTATKPECFDYFKSLGTKPIKVRWAQIIGPYWTGEKKFAEPRERLYQSGPLLPLNTNVTSGYDGKLW